MFQMAFTIEEIEKALITPRPEWPMYFPQNAKREESLNYSIITDYLTGHSTSLGSLQHDNKIYLWDTLINLLKNIENISPKEQLVLDVIYHPVVYPYMQHSLKHWLVLYAFNNQDKNSFQAVLNQFRHQGHNDDAIFNYLIFSLPFNLIAESNIENTALKEFLSNHIKKASKLIYLRQIVLHFGMIHGAFFILSFWKK